MLIFRTKLQDPRQPRSFVPNGNITSANIINYSAKDTRRVDLVFGVGYDDDIAKVKQVDRREVLGADERILKDPGPTVGLIELGAQQRQLRGTARG